MLFYFYSKLHYVYVYVYIYHGVLLGISALSEFKIQQQTSCSPGSSRHTSRKAPEWEP